MGLRQTVSLGGAAPKGPAVTQSFPMADMFSGIASGIQGVASLGNAYAQSQALKAQGEYQASVARVNAQLARYQGEQAIKRGGKEAVERTKQVRQLIGKQRAGYAAQGIEIDSGSAAEVQAETSSLGALDALTIRNNAWKEAWGYKVQAINYQSQGIFQQMAANNAARNTLLTGGMQAIGYGVQAAGSFSKYSDTKAKNSSSKVGATSQIGDFPTSKVSAPYWKEQLVT